MDSNVVGAEALDVLKVIQQTEYFYAALEHGLVMGFSEFIDRFGSEEGKPAAESIDDLPVSPFVYEDIDCLNEPAGRHRVIVNIREENGENVIYTADDVLGAVRLRVVRHLDDLGNVIELCLVAEAAGDTNHEDPLYL